MQRIVGPPRSILIGEPSPQAGPAVPVGPYVRFYDGGAWYFLALGNDLIIGPVSLYPTDGSVTGFSGFALHKGGYLVSRSSSAIVDYADRDGNLIKALDFSTVASSFVRAVSADPYIAGGVVATGSRDSTSGDRFGIMLDDGTGLNWLAPVGGYDDMGGVCVTASYIFILDRWADRLLRFNHALSSQTTIRSSVNCTDGKLSVDEAANGGAGYLFMGMNNGSAPGLYRMGFDGSGELKLVAGEVNWHTPDAARSRVVFSGIPTGESEGIWAVGYDGTGLTQLYAAVSDTYYVFPDYEPAI